MTKKNIRIYTYRLRERYICIYKYFRSTLFHGFSHVRGPSYIQLPQLKVRVHRECFRTKLYKVDKPIFHSIIEISSFSYDCTLSLTELPEGIRTLNNIITVLTNQ